MLLAAEWLRQQQIPILKPQREEEPQRTQAWLSAGRGGHRCEFYFPMRTLTLRYREMASLKAVAALGPSAMVHEALQVTWLTDKMTDGVTEPSVA